MEQMLIKEEQCERLSQKHGFKTVGNQLVLRFSTKPVSIALFFKKTKVGIVEKMIYWSDF
jgi:hypothetical protein